MHAALYQRGDLAVLDPSNEAPVLKATDSAGKAGHGLADGRRAMCGAGVRLLAAARRSGPSVLLVIS
jgi:hypothetical protein